VKKVYNIACKVLKYNKKILEFFYIYNSIVIIQELLQLKVMDEKL